MLYQIGPVTMDTRPFNADKFSRSAGADIAKKPTIGGLKPKEFMGEGDETITISGKLLPTKIGGLTELGTIDGLRVAGTALPVVRGDGRSLGWYMIESVRETHKDLGANGIGFVVSYSITLTKSQPNNTSFEIVNAILSIFDISGG